MAWLNRSIARLLPALPRKAVHLVARRYVAGTTQADAFACAEALKAEGCTATIDVLGEDVHGAAAADATTAVYHSLVTEMAARGLEVNVSVKLTALGLKEDEAACRERVADLCAAAASHGGFVRIDMEDSSCTQPTLDIYEALRGTHANVGPVLQAYLKRTPADARALAAHGANVRLCKGIYLEPPEIALQDRDAVRRNYCEALQALLAGGARVGIATHDELLVGEALRIIERLKVDRSRYEFQMLLGVVPRLRAALVAQGHRLRVYVPFGESWYEYSLRRLKENPEIVGHVVKATIATLLGRG